MKFTEVELPSNRRFGVFFTSVFFLFSGYFFWLQYINLSTVFFIMATAFGLVTLINPNLLLPLNKMWMLFGLLLGMIISPVVLGVLFFGLFTPMAIVMRLIGRDELRLKKYKTDTFWKQRSEADQSSEPFIHQY